MNFEKLIESELEPFLDEELEREFAKEFGQEKEELRACLAERVCPVCKKIFIPAPQHIYKERNKYNGKLVCSFSCEGKTFGGKKKGGRKKVKKIE